MVFDAASKTWGPSGCRKTSEPLARHQAIVCQTEDAMRPRLGKCQTRVRASRAEGWKAVLTGESPSARQGCASPGRREAAKLF